MLPRDIKHVAAQRVINFAWRRWGWWSSQGRWHLSWILKGELSFPDTQCGKQLWKQKEACEPRPGDTNTRQVWELQETMLEYRGGEGGAEDGMRAMNLKQRQFGTRLWRLSGLRFICIRGGWEVFKQGVTWTFVDNPVAGVEDGVKRRTRLEARKTGRRSLPRSGKRLCCDRARPDRFMVFGNSGIWVFTEEYSRSRWNVWHAFIHGWASHACGKLRVSLQFIGPSLKPVRTVLIRSTQGYGTPASLSYADTWVRKPDHLHLLYSD